MVGKFELRQSRSGVFTFSLKASNGQVLLAASETYTTKKAANNGIESVRKHVAKESSFERHTATSGLAYFVLRAANGQLIGKSQVYASTRSMEKGIESVRSNAASATVSDLTA